MKTKLGVLLLVFTVCVLCITLPVFVASGSVTSGFGEEENLPGRDIDLSYDIRVFVDSIDYGRKTASVYVSATVECSTNATEIGINLEGDAYGIIMCQLGGYNTFYGDKKFDDWPLRGAGETYPFDTYVLRGFISRQFYFVENQTAQIFYPNATFNTRFLILDRKMELQDPDSYFTNAQFIIRLDRDSSLQAIQLMVPVMFSFFVLGASVLIERAKMNERLSVYLALFFFAPTFLLATQSFLPNRSSLSIPEILIIGMIAATAFSAISTMVPSSKNNGRRLDILATMLSSILLFLLYYPVLELQASLQTIAILMFAEVGLASGVIIRRMLASKTLKRGFSRLIAFLSSKKVSTATAGLNQEGS
jgi:hypothetical protein